MSSMDRWPLVYIAGPYTKPDPVENVHRACMIAEHVEQYECAVFVPHLSMLWHLVTPAPIDVWYARDLRVLDHCDALIRFEGESDGADKEVAYARRYGIPVFGAPWGLPDQEFIDWRASFIIGGHLGEVTA